MSFEKKCQFCGKTFYTNRYTATFCSSSCYYKNKRAESNRKRLQMILEKYPEEDPYLKDGFIFYRKKCSVCGKRYETLHLDSKYCSEECHSQASRELRRIRDLGLEKDFKEGTLKHVPASQNVHKCLYCGRPFVAVRSTARFCSNDCYQAYRKREAQLCKIREIQKNDPDIKAFIKDGYIYFRKVCEECGNEFETIKMQARFCSDICQNRYQARRKKENTQRKRQLEALNAPESETMKGRWLKIRKVCEWCGSQFIAQKETTRFCSRTCAENFRKKQMQERQEHFLLKEAEISPVPEVRDVFKPDEAAEYMSISKPTLFRLIRDGSIQCIRHGHITLVTRDSILQFIKNFQRTGPGVRPVRQVKVHLSNPVLVRSEDYMSISDAAEFYGIDRVVIGSRLYHSKLPFERVGKVKYFFKNDVDRLVRKMKRSQHPEIKEWYSVEDIMEKFNMTRRAVYQFVNARNGIPTKKEGKLAYYSKQHVDRMCQPKDIDMDHYYTSLEASELIGANLNRLYKLLRKSGIPKVTIRGKIFIPKAEFDDLVALNASEKSDEI